MDFIAFNKKNRSYRNYDESYTITKTQLEELIMLTRFCPSSVNMQPFKYYLSYDKSTNDIIQPLTKWARALQPMELPRKGHCPTGFIVICYDTTIGPGIVAQTILLGAVDKGLGGCMIGNFSPEKISEALVLPSNLKPALIVALGKTDEKIVLLDAEEGADINYFRDINDIHYVPKRTLSELIINKDIIIK